MLVVIDDNKPEERSSFYFSAYSCEYNHQSNSRKKGGVLSQAENISKARNISSNEGNDQGNGGQSQKKNKASKLAMV